MIRSYKRNDEFGIQRLFKEVFKKELTLEDWRWKYIENSQQKTTITVAEVDDEIVGHVALVPVQAKWFDKEIVFGARTDTMVSPQSRGQGIYKKLNTHIIEQASSAQIDFLYGYPAIQAKKLLIRYTNAKEVDYVPRLIFINKPSRIIANKFQFLNVVGKLISPFEKLRLKHKCHSKHSYTIDQINKCGNEFDALWKKSASIANILIKRDATYLNWRYHRHPEKAYRMYALYEDQQLLGYTVVHEEHKSYEHGTLLFGTIVDMFAVRNEQVWEALIIYSLQALQHADLIQTWALSHTYYYRALRNIGFIAKDKPMPLVGNIIDKRLSHLQEGFTIDNWYITPGDVDSF